MAPVAVPAGAGLPSVAALRAPAEAAFARLARDIAADKELVPESFGELVCRFAEFPLLQFTGDEKETVALDGQPDGSGWARLAWDGLTALQEYAAAAVRGEAAVTSRRGASTPRPAATTSRRARPSAGSPARSRATPSGSANGCCRCRPAWTCPDAPSWEPTCGSAAVRPPLDCTTSTTAPAAAASTSGTSDSTSPTPAPTDTHTN
ncbi:hypothetical protein ACFQ1I_16990 [Kitasatospora arboriphila]